MNMTPEDITLINDPMAVSGSIAGDSFPDFDPGIARDLQEMGYQVAGGSADFLGVPLFDAPSLINLAVRFLFNLLVCWILVQFCYYRKSRRRDYYMTFMLFSSTMFLLIFLMENVSMQIGFTLGLFAIFGMIRYRTETVPIREMTYLFIIIGLSVINGLAMTVSYAELLVTNLLLVGLTWGAENARFLHHRASKIILYEKIDNIVPERRQELIDDLEKRTGLHILNLEIGHIDFLRDVAYIKVYYNDSDADNAFGNATKLKQMEG